MPTVRCGLYQFHLTDRYSAGHVLTEAEAAALNGLRAENIRNNLAAQVGKAAAGLPAGQMLSAEVLEQLAAAAAKYDAEYQFGQKRQYTRQGPIEIEAKALARQRIVAAALAAGQQISAEALQQQAEAMALRPDLQAEARQRVADAQQIAATALAELG